MRTILYMGITPNGFIAKLDGNSNWTSEEDLQGFYQHSEASGNCIMGRNTFTELLQQDQFPFPNCLNIVTTHEDISNSWGDNVVITKDTPEEVLQMIE